MTPRLITRRIVERVVISRWREGRSQKEITLHLKWICIPVREDEVKAIVKQYVSLNTENRAPCRREALPPPAQAFPRPDRFERAIAGLALFGALLAAMLNDWLISLYMDED